MRKPDGRPGTREVGVKGIAILSAAWLLLGFSLALAAEQAPARLSPRTPEMSTAGKVLEVSETDRKSVV